ncbi:MAG: hypothetical protein DIZ80_06540 [endosymbiont of Galathealinum brachiosum]|uniref:Uncharacterized protein n=1 Tax=endosymbiont of Galathealinum brachiosum TaxID=2200906 RepID=A0A370DFW1_9GAMM|nr:MAG: hypothetical protein DIZ80_06540 [endosymbiont of Galathealinum brachiosum]
MILSYSPSVYSQVSGRLDTLIETDQTEFYNRSLIEEQAEINWRNKSENMNAGFQADIRYHELDDQTHLQGELDQQINQLFLSHNIQNINYTVGRFDRSDLLGFYTLDGLIANYVNKSWTASFHAGTPRQLEDYNIIEVNRILGLDFNNQQTGISNAIVQNVNSYFGWQQLQDEVTQNYIHLGISGSGNLNNTNIDNKKISKNKLSQIKMFINGSYLIENKSAESINAGVQYNDKEFGLSRISYTSWKPEEAELSFKEQFYSVFSNSKQSILQADIFHKHKWDQQYYVRGRKVWRETGGDGVGLTFGFEQQAVFDKKTGWIAQWDSLAIKHDSIHSLYLSSNRNISASLRGHLDTALQYQKNDTVDNDSIVALQIGAEKMIQSDVYIDFNLRYIYNSNLDDEYRFGFRFSYRFDDRVWIRP